MWVLFSEFKPNEYSAFAIATVYEIRSYIDLCYTKFAHYILIS